jgi:hypothetical protein
MAWTKMGEIPNPYTDLNGDAFSGAVLKAYLPGTTTATSIAIDSSGASPQASITYNASGILEVSGNEIVPHIDRRCKWGIFANSTDAAANTPFAMGPFDNIDQVSGSGQIFDTVALMVANTSLAVGDKVRTLGYLALGDGGDNRYEIVAAATGTDDKGTFIDLATHQAKGLFPGGEYNVKQFGAAGDGVTDDVSSIQSAIDNLSASGGGTLLFPVGIYLLASKNSTTKNIIKIRPNVSMMGMGDLTEFKVDDGLISTDGVHVFRNDGEVIQNISFTNFKINFNGLNNLYPNGLAGGFFHGIRIKAVNGSESTENILIDNVTFFENPGAQCIVLTPSDDLLNLPLDCVINNCRFNQLGPAISGNIEITDHSAILAYLTRGKITNNSFFEDNLITSFTETAIEAHCRETVISGNVVKNLTVGVLIAGQTTNLTTSVVSDNILKNVDFGVYIWNGVSGSGGKVVEKITISDNVITVSDQSEASQGGIVPGTLEGPMTELTITGNTITQEGNVTSNSKNPKGIFLAWAENCIIANNNIFNFAGKAIEVSNSSTSRTMKRVNITGNIIRDIGLGGVAGNDYAIQAKGLNASFVAFDITIHDNQITGSFGEAIRIDGYVNGVDVQNNSIKPGTTNPVIFANFNASNINEINNWPERASAQPTTGFYINGKVIINNTAVETGSASSKYIVHGWRRLTTGSGHASPADWVEMRTLTGN